MKKKPEKSSPRFPRLRKSWRTIHLNNIDLHGISKASARISLPKSIILYLLSWCLLFSAPDSLAELPYLARGNLISAEYADFTSRVQSFQEKLTPLVKSHAPEQLIRLENISPEVQAYGYQLLPKIVPDKATQASPKVRSYAFSWVIIQSSLDHQNQRLGDMQTRLYQQLVEPSTDITQALVSLVDDLLETEKQRDFIDGSIKHSLFWQKAIHNDIPRFTRLTLLHDAAVKQQSLKDQIVSHASQENIVAALEAEISSLQNFIDENRDSEFPPKWLKLEQEGIDQWLITVPIYTDIADQQFLSECVEAIEKVWQASGAESSYRVKVELSYVAPAELYPDQQPPSKGQHIAAWQHAARFPKDKAAITTGANSTHAFPRLHVILGPTDITPNVVAHEFGHILGFDDRYFRGYRNLGSEGYEILEVVPSYTDLMAAPGQGMVLTSHFKLLIAAIKAGGDVND